MKSCTCGFCRAAKMWCSKTNIAASWGLSKVQRRVCVLKVKPCCTHNTVRMFWCYYNGWRKWNNLLIKTDYFRQLGYGSCDLRKMISLGLIFWDGDQRTPLPYMCYWVQSSTVSGQSLIVCLYGSDSPSHCHNLNLPWYKNYKHLTYFLA